VAPALPEPELGSFAPEDVRLAAAAWPLKAAEELRSAAVMTEAQRLAVLHGFGLDISAALVRIVQDELVHVELCQEVGRRLGIESASFSLDWVHARFASLPDERCRFWALLTVELAMGESLSTALFLEGARQTTEPLQKAALQHIVEDEALHARIGWEILAALESELSSEERNFLRQEVRQQLASLEQAQAAPSLARLQAGETIDPALTRLGVLSPETRVNAFYRTLETRVLSSLDKLGLEGSRGWKERYRDRKGAVSGGSS
jgi:hypothetical protein